MSHSVELYDSSYAAYSAQLYEEIRQETYGLDLGQTGWMMAEEFHSFFGLLDLNACWKSVAAREDARFTWRRLWERRW